jgi:hypothetical protein
MGATSLPSLIPYSTPNRLGRYVCQVEYGAHRGAHGLEQPPQHGPGRRSGPGTRGDGLGWRRRFCPDRRRRPTPGRDELTLGLRLPFGLLLFVNWGL